MPEPRRGRREPKQQQGGHGPGEDIDITQNGSGSGGKQRGAPGAISRERASTPVGTGYARSDRSSRGQGLGRCRRETQQR
jgi:hypothetical protein